MRLHLPSGRVVSLGPSSSADQALRTPPDRFDIDDTPERHAAAFGPQGWLELRDGGGQVVELDAMTLEDFHVLRTVATALDFFVEPPVVRRCTNCDETFPLELSKCVPLGPLLDGELSDEELDEPFDFDKEHDLFVRADDDDQGDDEPNLRREAIGRVGLSPLTVGEARALWKTLAEQQERQRQHGISAADRRRLSRHLGLRSIDGEAYGPRARKRLGELSDDGWDALLDLFEAAHYCPRIDAHIRCPHCEAENVYRAPLLREFPEIVDDRLAPPWRDEVPGFPSPDAFLASMHQIGKKLYDQANVRSVPLFLELDVPHVDDGGQPLLGSYTPPPDDGLDGIGALAAGEIRLYYRTFKRQWADLGPYDVDAEIHETIEHELAHHLAFLRGYDETDEEERAEIVRERERVMGKGALARQAKAEQAAHRAGSWTLWLIVALLALFAYLSLRAQ